MNITLKRITAAVVLSAVALTSLPLSAFAIKNVDVKNNGNGTVTVTSEDTEKMAVAQYDKLGFIKTMGISNLVGGKQSTTVKYDSSLPLKVIGFEDWESLKADSKAYTVGSKTLVYIDFDEGTQSPFLMYDLGSFKINSSYNTTDKSGKATKGLSVKYLADGKGRAANIQIGNS